MGQRSEIQGTAGSSVFYTGHASTRGHGITYVLQCLGEPLMEEGVKRFPRFPHVHHSPAFFCRSGGVRYPRAASPRPAQVRLLHHCGVLLLSYAGEV